MLSFYLLPLGAGLLGMVLGSFLNALSFRFNTGRSMGGRSHCMTCRHVLGPLDLVPVFSYLFLGGRCRYCRARMSAQYPIVESVAGGIGLALYLAHPMPLPFFYWLCVWMTILFIVIYDLRHTIIPWSASITLAMLALGSFVFVQPVTVGGLLAGPAMALPLFLLSLVSRGRWMGWGDSAFAISLGWLLGLMQGLTALMCSFWSGALISVGILGVAQLWWRKKGKRLTMGSEIPFAPFLALGFAIVFFTHADLFSIIAPW